MNRRILLTRAGTLLPVMGAVAALAACSKEEAPTTAAASTTAPATASATATASASASAPAATDASGAKQSLTPAQQLELAATGSGFTIGPVMAANTVYVFFDSQCPHCAALWQACGEVGSRFRMQWMPVAFLARISQPQGAAIITAKDPAALMTENEGLLMQRKGGLDVTTLKPPEDALAKVKANTDLMARLGADSVPMIYFKNQKTGAYGSHSGALPIQALLELVGAA